MRVCCCPSSLPDNPPSLLLAAVQAVDFSRDVLPYVCDQLRIKAYPHRTYWEDVGSLRDYYAANIALAKGVSEGRGQMAAMGMGRGIACGCSCSGTAKHTRRAGQAAPVQGWFLQAGVCGLSFSPSTVCCQVHRTSMSPIVRPNSAFCCLLLTDCNVF
jgi:hypothetical protein